MNRLPRPDNRPSEVVWKYFELEFVNGGYPSVSWALGSDWGVDTRLLTAEEYKAMAYAHMELLYGPKGN